MQIKSRLVYPYSLEHARERQEELLWRDSHHANVNCAKAIDDLIGANYDGSRLNGELGRAVISEFGIDRPLWVLANTLKQKPHDRRFSKAHMAWAQTINTPDPSYNGYDTSQMYLLNTHPAILDGFAGQLLTEYLRMGLLDKSYCMDNAVSMDYKGRILILSPLLLQDAEKHPVDQLVYALDGPGCMQRTEPPEITGIRLSDGSSRIFFRADFCGIMNEIYLPPWAAARTQEVIGIYEETKMQEQSMEL
ncbi:MAG: DUF3849 domain-containing protein [Saccharofermentanales bacterium]